MLFLLWFAIFKYLLINYSNPALIEDVRNYSDYLNRMPVKYMMENFNYFFHHIRDLIFTDTDNVYLNAISVKSRNIERNETDRTLNFYYEISESILESRRPHKRKVLIQTQRSSNYNRLYTSSISPMPRIRNTEYILEDLLLIDFIENFYSMRNQLPYYKEMIENLLNRLAINLNSTDVTDVGELEQPDTQPENPPNFEFDPTDSLGCYTHRSLGNLPIRADVFGVELEYSGDIVGKISHFGIEFTYLLNNGWLLEHDGSVTFEMKSPIMSLAEVKVDFNKCKPLFNAWAEHTDGDKAGLHVHVSFDDMFATGKRPAGKTLVFLTKLLQNIESTVFPNPDGRVKLFKRDFTHYAQSILQVNNILEKRYLWINLQNLNKDASKTIEFRLGSSKLAGELDVYVEKVYILAKFIKYALQDWRSKGRPEYSSWKASFGDTKLFKALLPKDMLIRFMYLFK